jgi:multisubunit Na+/H+ antiporter MnhC subunit
VNALPFWIILTAAVIGLVLAAVFVTGLFIIISLRRRKDDSDDIEYP